MTTAVGVRRRVRRAALRLTTRRADAARAAWDAWRTGRGAPPVLELEAVRRRIELLLAALYAPGVRVEAAPAPVLPWARRLAARAGQLLGVRAAADDAPLPVLDGGCVRLPAAIDAAPGGEAALAHYRLLAVEQAERLARNTALWVPDHADPLARDLFLVAEGAAVDRAIARRAPGLGPALAAARRAAAAARPAAPAAGHAAAVERLLRRVLAAPVDAPPDDLPAGTPADEPTPAAMLTWARSTAAAIRAATPAAPGPTGRGAAYGGVPPVAYWGAPPVAAPSLARAGADDDRPVAGRPPDRGRDGSQRAPIVPLPGQRSREARAGDAEPRAGLAAADAPEPSAVEDPRGAPTPAAAGDGGPAATGTHGGTPYPEWDHAARQYRRDAALVRDLPAAAGDGAWADGVLAAHAALVRRVRARFEPLRARRARLGRQPRGDEIDLAAYVDAHADRLAGRGDGDDRLYVATTPARRALAILVLVDVSGSTDARVDGGRRIVDVEREAVLLAAGALDALGDAYAVATFSSRGARDVRVTTLKGFAERDAALFRRRVGAVLPGANTRLGAALRHATALLARQPAGHRLLLLLSDGRPNDMDGYQGPYGVEDARQAVHEARASGVLPFCLTVDREEPEYLAHVFGAAGHTVLRRPDQLPLALVAVVRQLLGAGRS